MSAPALVTVANGTVTVDLANPRDRYVALLPRLAIPAAHVTSVALLPDPVAAVEGWRAPGLGLPHLRMGTWRHDGVKDYVIASSKVPGLVMELSGEEFARVIVSVDDPDALLAALQPPTS